MSVVDRQEWDVVVVGAGARGPARGHRGARAGARTAVICKSLFGKAHTVMAEGGIAAAMANANEHDTWQVHFRDTMRGGKFLEPVADGRAARAGGPGPGVGSWRPGARCSTGRRTAGSRSGTSAGTSTRAWRTSATAPAWS